jgi:hypothetical protein
MFTNVPKAGTRFEAGKIALANIVPGALQGHRIEQTITCQKVLNTNMEKVPLEDIQAFLASIPANRTR